MRTTTRGTPQLVALALGAALAIPAVAPAPAAAQAAPDAEPATAAPAETSDDAATPKRAPEGEAAAAQDEFDRRAVQRLLRRPEVREAAEKAGVQVERVEDAVDDLSRSELRTVGERARELNDDLDISNDQIVIPVTTLIIGLLVLILILVA